MEAESLRARFTHIEYALVNIALSTVWTTVHAKWSARECVIVRMRTDSPCLPGRGLRCIILQV